MTLYGKRLKAGAIIVTIAIAVIIILASIPAKAGAEENRILHKAWETSGAQADEYDIKAYWKYAGEKGGGTASQMTADMAEVIGLKADAQIYSAPDNLPVW